MSDPYREGVPPSGLLDCPRCAKPLPPMDVATCPGECGTWVNATVAHIAFQPDETAANHSTRWWRVREPCPVCKEQMLLRGSEDHELFQGCEKHGYWIDADTVSKTSLGRPGLLARLRKLREDEEAQKFARAKQKADAEAAAVQAAKDKEERERENKRLVEERERDRAQKREAARKELETRKQEAERKEAEEKRAKEEAKRAAKEREVTQLEARRAELTASVQQALTANDPQPIVQELLRLEGLITELSKSFGRVSRHFVFGDED